MHRLHLHRAADAGQRVCGAHQFLAHTDGAAGCGLREFPLQGFEVLAGFVGKYREERRRDGKRSDPHGALGCRVFRRSGRRWRRMRRDCRWRRFALRRLAVTNRLGPVHDRLRIGLRLAALQTGDPLRECAVRELDQLEQARVRRALFLLPEIHHLLDRPRRFAQAHEADHAAAALQGVISPPDQRELREVGRLRAAGFYTARDGLQHADGFLEKDREQLLVDRLVALAFQPLGFG